MWKGTFEAEGRLAVEHVLLGCSRGRIYICRIIAKPIRVLAHDEWFVLSLNIPFIRGDFL